MKISIYQPHFIHHVGQRKDENDVPHQEDSLFPDEHQATTETRLFLVCDGMGGHSKGEVASQTVCQAFDEYFKEHADYNQVVDDSVLRGALASAYTQLNAQDDGAYKKMGTTLTLVCLHKGGITMAYVGDSRIYHIRPGEEKPLFQSRDHSLVYDMYQAGEITFEEMKTDRRRNIITRALMPCDEDDQVDLTIVHTTDIEPGDYFYLCSDGMLEKMENDELVALLSTDDSDETKIATLLQRTAENGDNHTAYLIRVKEVLSEAGDKKLFHDEDTSRANAVNIVPIVEHDISIVTRSVPEEAITAPTEPGVEPGLVVTAADETYDIKEDKAAAPPIPMSTQPSSPLPPPVASAPIPPAAPKSNRAMFWLPLVVCLGVLGGAVWWFLNQNDDDKNSTEEQTTVAPSQQPIAPAQTASPSTLSVPNAPSTPSASSAPSTSSAPATPAQQSARQTQTQPRTQSSASNQSQEQRTLPVPNAQRSQTPGPSASNGNSISSNGGSNNQPSTNSSINQSGQGSSGQGGGTSGSGRPSLRVGGDNPSSQTPGK